jgi:hypothetical protein
VRVGPRLALARCAERHSAGTLGFTRVSSLPECRNHAKRKRAEQPAATQLHGRQHWRIRCRPSNENARALDNLPRYDHVVAAIRWCALSVGWALLVGAASLAAGLAAGSTALVGFGLSSLVDGTASSILVWRFRQERLGVRPSDELERRAALLVVVILVLIAFYLAARASTALADQAGPEPSDLGIALTSASMLVLPCSQR